MNGSRLPEPSDASLSRRDRLECRGRTKLPQSQFEGEQRLYFAFDRTFVDDEGRIKTEALRLPDFSCNWERFSIPEDVRYRKNGRLSDGCAAIRVDEVWYQDFATAVHDPICDEDPENYSHVEVRVVPPGSQISDEPPRNSRYKGSKSRRTEWRRHIRNRLTIELHPAQD